MPGSSATRSWPLSELHLQSSIGLFVRKALVGCYLSGASNYHQTINIMLDVESTFQGHTSKLFTPEEFQLWESKQWHLVDLNKCLIEIRWQIYEWIFKINNWQNKNNRVSEHSSQLAYRKRGGAALQFYIIWIVDDSILDDISILVINKIDP
jgi:hypothetical protein